MIDQHIWIYSSMRNEATLLPYWLRHYQSFADRIIVYEDDSTDATREILTCAGAEVRTCPWNGIDDIAHSRFASEQYKEARGYADWVFWVDGDEFIYHPTLKQRLADLQQLGVTLPYVDGYSMFADSFPKGDGQIYTEHRNGVRDGNYDKPAVIDPNTNIVWDPGRHMVISDKPFVRDDGGLPHLKLLHYRWFGREEYLQRNASNWSRISQGNLDYGLGINVAPESTYPTHTVSWYEKLLEQAQPCVEIT